MIFNLLTILLMATTDIKKDVVIQPVQQAIERPQKQFNSQDIGYTQRAIDSKTQTRGRYLDGIRALQSDQDISTTTDTEITWYTYTKTGKFDFTRWSTDSIIVPENWTYMIIADFQWTEVMAVWETIHWVKLDWANLYSQNVFNVTATNTYTLSWVENLTKWEEITVNVFHIESEARKVKIKISLTKLS